MIIIDIGDKFKSVEEACGIVLRVRNLDIKDSYIKFQLTKDMDRIIFDRASRYCHVVGMPYGVSIYDEESLDLAIHSGALQFIKIEDDKYKHLIPKIPKQDRIIMGHESGVKECSYKDVIKDKKNEDNRIDSGKVRKQENKE